MGYSQSLTRRGDPLMRRRLWFGCIVPLALCASLRAQQAPVVKNTPVKAEKGLEELTKSAAAGDGEAMRALGERSETGNGVPQDYAAAAHWYRLAAEKGSTVAMVDIGVLCGRGNGVQQSYGEEMHWYRLAANKGNDVAMLYLGHMYKHGGGVPQDYPQALVWYRKSAEMGNASALDMVGEMYRDGEGVPQDYAEAYFWLNLSTVDSPPGTRQDRDAIAGKLSPPKLTEIQEQCRHWAETHPKIHFTP
jgi:TPR repeat protein